MRLARRRGVIRPRDLAPYGISREILRRLTADGRLERRGRGLYVPSRTSRGENEMLATVARRVPHGVVCLLSALRFHEMTTQNPRQIWLAIDHKARTPNIPDLPLRVVRFSGEAFTEGIEMHRIDGVDVAVTSRAKTVADCFKYRGKIGTDVALEALRACWNAPNRKMRCSIDEIWRYAMICRVTAIMRPYLEAVTAET